MAVAILRNMAGLVFDAVLRESHGADLTITDNPVETGVKVSDHAYMEPRTVTIEAGVSDTPLQQTAGDSFAGDTSRSRQAYALLEQLQAAAEPFTVQTGLKLYENMLVKRLSADQDSGTAGALLFTAELREVIIVNTQTVEYSTTGRRTGATKRQADKKKDAGEQQGGNVPVAKQSLLRRIKDAL